MSPLSFFIIHPFIFLALSIILSSVFSPSALSCSSYPPHPPTPGQERKILIYLAKFSANHLQRCETVG